MASKEKQSWSSLKGRTQSGSADGELTINDLVADTHNPTPDIQVEDNDQLRRLEQLLDEIDERSAALSAYCITGM